MQTEIDNIWRGAAPRGCRAACSPLHTFKTVYQHGRSNQNLQPNREAFSSLMVLYKRPSCGRK